MKKNKLLLWLFGGLAVLFSSCLGDTDTDLDEWALSDCQISSFSLACDSISGLSSVKFTIDQLNGQIYNRDSMPYGTNINFKVSCSVTYVTGYVSSTEVTQTATGEKAYWNGSDSLDFTSEVLFYVVSYDGKKGKSYTAKLNVHQQHPDSMIWAKSPTPLPAGSASDRKVVMHDDHYRMYVRQGSSYQLYQSPATDVNNWTTAPAPLSGLSGKTFALAQMTEYEGNWYVAASDGSLYRSADGINWAPVENAPQIVALAGVVHAGVKPERPSALAALIKDGGQWMFAAMNASGEWQTGTEAPADFPVTGFASNSYEQVYYNHLTVVAGKDRNGSLSSKSWDTMDGLSWICLTRSGLFYFSQREGVMLTNYDDKLYLAGGIDASGKGLKDMYTSIDKGITWAEADSMTFLPDEFTGRGYASVIVDKDNYMFLFSGKESTDKNMSDELWCGRINRLGYKD